ncbi:MAG: hypothetical protein DWP97_01050 [Calditrichaeota bacterium]|nr:MAG: hypothetical protein DWP97_01050 [Calditrichota bacterium]
MPIKPEKRNGKGTFQETTESQVLLDQSNIDITVQKASERIVLFDFLYMIIVGFLKTISGFLGIEDNSSDKNKGDKK